MAVTLDLGAEAGTRQRDRRLAFRGSELQTHSLHGCGFPCTEALPAAELGTRPGPLGVRETRLLRGASPVLQGSEMGRRTSFQGGSCQCQVHW